MQPTQPPAGGYSRDPYGQYPGCYRHPDRPTGVRCVRCDRPICGECQRPAAVGFQCPDDVRAGSAEIRRPRTLLGSVVADGIPYATYALILANVVVYLVTAVQPGANLIDNQHAQLFAHWAMWPNGVGYLHQYYRMITSAFLHIGPLHLVLNMFALYVIGPGLERAMGRSRFLALYFLAAFGGSVAILLFGDRNQPVAGASGAIFGLFAAAWLLSRVIGLDTRPMTALIIANFIFTAAVPGISKLGHVGGFVVGGIAMFALLGWTLDRGKVHRRTLQNQLISLFGIAVVLVLLTVVGAQRIESTPLPVTVRSVHTASVVHTVDQSEDNYSDVITAVKEPVDK
jgi:membrane associated rhomboid family serine protease